MRNDSRTRATAVVAIVLALFAGACGREMSAEETPGCAPEAGAPSHPSSDAGVPSHPSPDAGVPSDAGPDAFSGITPVDCQSQPATYGDLTDPRRWETFDSTSLNPAARGFTGMAYDGHYVYFVPYDTNTRSGIVARYEAAGPFSSPGSWKTFDLSTLDPEAKGYLGSTFDGRYVYFAQFNNGTEYGGRVARFDTAASFESATAWTIFDASTVDAASRGFAGTIFDGRYIYFLPYFNVAYDGVVTRYDTHADFGSSAAWTTFDLTAKNPSARGYVGGTFDGRYIYLTPFATESSYSSTFARYDTQKAFGDTTSWSTFDTTTVDPNALGYGGAVFDGHYAYFFPTYNWIGGAHGDVVRFDTTAAAFTDPAAWTTFDVSTTNPAARGYIGGVFDGRYITLVPSWKDSGTVARYDTLASFGTAMSWSTFDLTTLSPKAKGFHSGGFDGRYIYMAEYWDGTEPNGLVVRFDAKSTTCGPAIPASYLPNLAPGISSFF